MLIAVDFLPFRFQKFRCSKAHSVIPAMNEQYRLAGADPAKY